MLYMNAVAAAPPDDGLHPLDEALRAAGLTQADLSELISKLRLRRQDGSLLTLAQSSISNICNWKRGVSPEVAEGIVLALKDRAFITAAAIVFAKRPEQHAVAKPKKTKPRHRAA
jgi:hypothetical protein